MTVGRLVYMERVITVRGKVAGDRTFYATTLTPSPPPTRADDRMVGGGAS